MPFDQRQVVENMGAFHLTNYPGLEFQKIHVANGTVFFRFSIIFEEQRKCRQVDPNSRRFHPGNFHSIRFCYLNFQNFRLNGLLRNSFRFCLLGENISGNFSPTRSLLVKCILEDNFERGKMEYHPGKIFSEPTREHTATSTHIRRRRRDLNTGDIGGMRVLSPVRPLCSIPFHFPTPLINQKGSTQA